MPPDPVVDVKGAASAPSTGFDPVRDRIDKLATAIRQLHHQGNRGVLARLRRMDEARCDEQALYRLLAVLAPDAGFDARLRRNDIGRLALMTKVLALGMSIEVLGNGYYRLGRMMAEMQASERRVQMLMQARGLALDDLILRLSRRLVREGSLPYLDIGRLILGSDEMVEATRRIIAKEYWVPRFRNDGAADEHTAGGEAA